MAFGGENAESYYDEGITASMKGDLEVAISFFERAIQMDNSMSAAYHQLGKCYYRLGRPKKAAAFFLEVMRTKPKSIPLKVDLGYAFLARNQAQQAREQFSEVIQTRPQDSRAQLGLGQCAFIEGNWAAAVEFAQTVTLREAVNFAAFFLLGRAARFAGNDGLSADALGQAEKLMEKNIENSPDQPEGYYLKGEVFFAKGDYAKALDAYGSAVDRAVPAKHYTAFGEHFKLIDILAKRGLCYQKQDHVDGALETGEKILALDPDHKIGRMLAGKMGQDE